MENCCSNSDEVSAFIARRDSSWQTYAQNNAVKYEEIKKGFITDGICIGISPRDEVLEKFDRGEITNIISDIFKRKRARMVRSLPPSTPFQLELVGEYSEKYRFHYHGIINVPNIKILDSIKRILQRKIGRVVIEQIKNYGLYIDYIFKQYVGDKNNYYCWDINECYICVK